MPDAHPNTEVVLTQPPANRMPVGRPWPKGVSGNPSGRPKQHALDKLLELELQDGKVIRELAQLAKSGDLPAMKYCLDRIAGQPVQRHEAKLLAQVDDTAKLLAQAYGLSEQEVRDRARQIAQGT